MEKTKIVKFFQFYFDGIVDGINIKYFEISKEHSGRIVNSNKTFGKRLSFLIMKQVHSGCNFSLKGQVFKIYVTKKHIKMRIVQRFHLH